MVSVVIVNWNSGPLLERCVRSLGEHAPNADIVVVDNGSGDGSLAFTEEIEPPLKVIRNRENAGFAAACNQGWRAMAGEQILFLNPDTECLAGAAERLAVALGREDSIWAAGGCLVDDTGNPQAGFHLRAFPTIGAVAAELLLLDEIWPNNRWTRRYRMADWNHDARGDVDQPAAACLMVRRCRLEELDGFDERFRPAWFEDVDLCRRIRNTGGRIVYEPEARFRHKGGVSLRSLDQEEFLLHYHANQIRYFAKHHGEAAAGKVRSLVIAGLRLRACLRFYRRAQSLACWNAAHRFAGGFAGTEYRPESDSGDSGTEIGA